jgi:hypothetical protein
MHFFINRTLSLLFEHSLCVCVFYFALRSSRTDLLHVVRSSGSDLPANDFALSGQGSGSDDQGR